MNSLDRTSEPPFRWICPGCVIASLLVLSANLILADTPVPARTEPPKLVIDTQGFAAAVKSLDFSPDGKLLAATGADKVVRIWDVESLQLKATLRGYDGKASEGLCQALRFSPDGRFLVVGVQDFSAEGSIRVYDTTKLDEIQALLPGHAQGGVYFLEFSDDGRFLATVGADGELILWSWPDRRVLGKVRVETRELQYFGFVPDLPILFAVDSQGFHAWSASRAKDLNRLSPAEENELGGRAVYSQAVGAMYQFGPTIAQLAYLDSGKRNSIRVKPSAGIAIIGGNSKRNGKVIYWSGIWSLRDGRPIALHEGHNLIPFTGAITQDGTLAASGDIGGDIHLYDGKTGAARHVFRAVGKPIYKVGFATEGQSIAFGTRPFKGDRWQINSYGDFDRSFDFVRKQLVEEASGDHLEVPTQLGSHAVTLETFEDRYALKSLSGGKVESRYPFPRGVIPQSFGLIRSDRTGVDRPIVMARNDSSLGIYDPKLMVGRRELVGHRGAINALGESPDGLFLISGADDRTIRFWSLSGFKQDAMPDFDTGDALAVNYLIPGGQAERAGILVGDRFIRMDGKETGYIIGEYLAGRWPYRAGQRVWLDMERAGKPYQVEIALVAQGDFAEPAMTLFVADDEWIIWTPQGYYDASPQGDRLIGWLVNQGRDSASKFYLAEQFRKLFYRPDVISHLFKTGRVDAAISAANNAKARPPKPLDLRQPGQLATLEPPRVKLDEPTAGMRTRKTQVTVTGMVESVNNQALGEVKILVNGRPVAGKSVARRLGDTDRTRTIDREVPLQPGSNTIAVIAANQLATSKPTTVQVFCDAAPLKSDAKKALVLAIGISDYRDPNFKLDFAHRDAQDFADAWMTQQGPLYGSVETHVLTNQQASVAGMRDGMDWLQKNVAPNDLAVLFISAHGLNDGDGGFYVASHEVDPNRLLATTIPNTDIIRLAEGLRCRVLVFLDTCHSGGMLRVGGNREDAFRDLVSDQVGAWMYASSTPGGLSYEDPKWKHGAFTKAILEAFADPTCYKNERMSTGRLAFQVNERVAELTAQKQRPVNSYALNVPSFDFFTFSPALKTTLRVDRRVSMSR